MESGLAPALSSVEYSKTKTRRDYSALKALDPHDGGCWDLLLSGRALAWTASRGKGASLELAYTVRWTLENPSAIFLGVRDLDREIDEAEWLCYASKPNFAYNHKTGEKVCPAWEDKVFLVFVNEERVVYLWYWCQCDAMDGRLPIDHEGRFRERVWP